MELVQLYAPHAGQIRLHVCTKPGAHRSEQKGTEKDGRTLISLETASADA